MASIAPVIWDQRPITEKASRMLPDVDPKTPDPETEHSAKDNRARPID
jgi:hypothetical protein